MPAYLQAGTAAIDVTPPLGTNMGGYASRDHGAEGVHDPLTAKALTLTDGPTTVLLVTCDIISFDYGFIDPLMERIEQATGIPRSHVLVSNSHTHSGPLTPGVSGFDLVDEQYVAVLADKLVSIAGLALEDPRPVTVGFGRANVRVGYNRRETTAEGVRLGIDPRGPLAPFFDVIALRDEAGDLLATWFCHAAHAVVLGGDNYLISADYPGPAQQAVEAVHPGARAMFAQGCCGDINAERGRPGTFEEVRSRGLKLAGAVMMAVEEAPPVPDATLGAASRCLELPLRQPPPAAQVEAELEQLRPQYEQARQAEDTVQERVLKWRIRRRETMLEAAREGVAGTKRFDVTALRIGPAAIVGLPGEVFVRYALNIPKLSPFNPTIVPAYTNGMVGYVPTADAFPKGGYEVDTSWDYYGGLGIGPECESIILEGTGELLASLNR
ncbi:MAG: neutral/alkaline non-lysosomal ceramidase N-terminal domain-containing protein [Armatimonadota bacterium]